MIPFLNPHLMQGAAPISTLLPQTVFASSLYTGTGASQTITNGLDLLGSGGLVWQKSRSGANIHTLVDTTRGGNAYLNSTATDAEVAATCLTFGSTGFTSVANFQNGSGATYASWSFRQAPKFFQIVTYTGDGTSGRQIPHTLGVAPGMIVVKRRDSTGDWPVWHAGAPTGYLVLNQTLALTTSNAAVFFGNGTTVVQPTAANFTVASNGLLNAAGAQYIAYLWAHDPDTTNGIVQCGSFTADGSGNASVNLGWSPQFVLQKCSNSAGFNWTMLDASRGWASGTDATLYANLSNAETNLDFGAPNATGFTVTGGGASNTYVYLAIRAPVFLGPTRPQDAFATSLYTGTGVNSSVVNGLDLAGQGGLVWEKTRGIVNSHRLADTLRGGGKTLSTDTTGVETTSALYLTSFSSTGFARSAYDTGTTVTAWSFVRKPKFFDCVTYTGDGTSGRQIAHALGVAPGMIVVKRRDAVGSWFVYHRALGDNTYLALDSAQPSASATTLVQTANASTFTVGTSASANANGGTYVAFLWAHDPSSDGLVQAGSFTADGSGNATISLGWRPQFVLLKCSGAAAPWTIQDTARGWTSSNKYLQPNSSAAETANTGGGIPTSSGFTVTSADASPGLQHVFLAIREPTT